MKSDGNSLIKLPNIGKVLADRLKLVGIMSASDLKEMGAERIFLRLKTIDKSVCVNTLWAIEGAVQGIRWHDIDQPRKEELKNFFKMTQRLDSF